MRRLLKFLNFANAEADLNCEERDHLRGLQKLIKLFRFPLKFLIKDRTSCFKADILIFLKMNLEMGHHSQSLIHLVSFFFRPTADRFLNSVFQMVLLTQTLN